MTGAKKESFILRHLEPIVCFLIWCAGLIYTHGATTAKVAALESELTRLQATSSSLEQTKWVVDQHERSIFDMKSEQKKHGENISEIKTDVRLIAEWVKEQKSKHKSELDDELPSRPNP